MVDRDGLPHYTGENADLIKEYRKRVKLALARLEGSGDEATKIDASLKQKRRRFRVKLLDGLHGKAWRRAEHLALDPTALKVENGEDLIFEALAGLDKESIIKKAMAFDVFFKKSYRRRGVSMTDYVAEKEKLWGDLQEKDEETEISDDLMA